MLSSDLKFLLDTNFNFNGCSVSSGRSRAAIPPQCVQLNCDVITDSEQVRGLQNYPATQARGVTVFHYTSVAEVPVLFL